MYPIQSNRGSASLIVISILAILCLTLAFASCAIVPPGHRGISVTLGKVDPVALGEGFTLKKPFIETIVRISTRQITEKRTTPCFTSDLQTVTVSYSCLYRLPENKVVELYQQYSGNVFDNLIEPRYQEALKQVTAAYTAEHAVKNRETIKTKALDRLRAELKDLVTIIDIPITNIDLSDEMEHAIEKKQIMEQQALTKNYELDRQRKEAEITEVNAKAEAAAITIKAAALKASPELVAFEIAKKWNGVSPTSVVVQSGGANVLLPLK